MKKLLFLAILVFCIALRFYKITEVPISLNWDEVSNTYNAYSILKTGRDEYGNFLPLANRSFDDYKPPAYMYFSLPTVWMFGLSEIAARLPAAVFGILTCIAIFFLTKILTGSDAASFASFFLLSVTPWHIQFSRAGFEANVGLFFMVAGLVFLLYAIKNYPSDKNHYVYFLISALFIALSFYSYHAYRIIVLLILVALFLIYRNTITKIHKKTIAIYLIVIFSFIAPLFLTLPKEAFVRRFESTSQKVQKGDVDKSIELIDQDLERNFTLGRLIHNRRAEIAKTYASNYLSHFNFNFLFLEGDAEIRHHVKNMGVLFLFQLPLLMFGIYHFFQNFDKNKMFVISMLLIAPVGAVTGAEVPHAIRGYSMVIPFTIISALGLVKLWKIVIHKYVYIFVFAITIFLSSLAYFEEYFKHYPIYSAQAWQYVSRETALVTKNLEDKYAQIIVDSQNIEQAYIFWLFYTNFDPANYQKSGSKEKFGKYVFKSIAPEDKNSLFVTNTLPDNFKKIESIDFPDGERGLEIGSIR